MSLVHLLSAGIPGGWDRVSAAWPPWSSVLSWCVSLWKATSLWGEQKTAVWSQPQPSHAFW